MMTSHKPLVMRDKKPAEHLDPPCVGTALYRGLQWVPVIVGGRQIAGDVFARDRSLVGVSAALKTLKQPEKDSPTFNPCASEARFCAAIFRGLSLIVSTLRSYRLRMRGNRQLSNQLEKPDPVGPGRTRGRSTYNGGGNEGHGGLEKSGQDHGR